MVVGSRSRGVQRVAAAALGRRREARPRRGAHPGPRSATSNIANPAAPPPAARKALRARLRLALPPATPGRHHHHHHHHHQLRHHDRLGVDEDWGRLRLRAGATPPVGAAASRRQLLRPHSTGSTASSASSASSAATATSSSASSSASSSSSSWGSAGSSPPEPAWPAWPPSSPLTAAMAWRPVTRRAARAARELHSAWSGRVGVNSFIPSDKVQQLFNDLQLYPSKSEVMEMLRSAQQSGHRSTPNSLTFGEFCVFATELQRCVDKGASRSTPLSRLLERDGEEKRRARRKVSKGLPKYEVFLGGSCNPTTWRQDVAIPLLKNMGITFYNPQVTDWAPELIEKEHYAKQTAAVLFFVIDNQTRNTASTIEVAFYAGLKRSLVLVVHPYQSSNLEISGEAILDEELGDLAAGQQVMQMLAERQGIPVFSNVPLAVSGIAKVLWENLSVQDLHSGKKGSAQISDRGMKLREAFDAVDMRRSGEIGLKDVRLAFWILNNRNLSLSDLRSAGVLEKETKENIPFENLRINFEQFCAIVAEFESNQERWNVSPVRTLKSVSSNFLSNQPSSFDVYLGGSSLNTSWREDVAIPLLKKHGLKYVIPPSHQWTKQTLQASINYADRSRVILFVITDTSRSLADLCMVAHYIGLGFDVVLYVGLLTEDSIINGQQLSKVAVKDYNRGRMYLRDLAVREGIPVSDSISAAVEIAASKCLNSSLNN